MVPWTVACQAPLSMGFSRCVPSPSPEDPPNPGIKPVSPASPALTGRFFTAKTPSSYLQGGINSESEGTFVNLMEPFLKEIMTAKGNRKHSKAISGL